MLRRRSPSPQHHEYIPLDPLQDGIDAVSVIQEQKPRSYLVFAIPLLLMLILILLISPSPPCSTGHCLKVSSRLSTSISTSTSPCSDFYNFTCNSWRRDHTIPSNKSVFNIFSVVSQQNELIVKEILENPESDQMTQNCHVFYSSCMSTDRNLNSLVDIITTDLSDLNNIQVYPYFKLVPVVNEKYPSTSILKLFQGGLLLPQEYYGDTNIMELYQQVVEYCFAEILPLLNKKGDYKEIAKRVVLFESTISNFTVSKQDLAGTQSSLTLDPKISYNLYKWNDLSSLAPFVDWNEYLKKTYPPSIYSSVLNDSSEIVIQVPSFLKSLSKLVQENNEITEFYIVWCVISKFSHALPFNLRDEINKLLVSVGADPKYFQINTLNA